MSVFFLLESLSADFWRDQDGISFAIIVVIDLYILSIDEYGILWLVGISDESLNEYIRLYPKLLDFVYD